METKAYKILKSASLLVGIAALTYLFFYDFYFEPNPEYGNRASTASNVGRDHWAAFILWGVLLELAFLLNFFFAMKKFNVNNKLPKVFALLSIVGMAGFLLCKNEKFKRFSWTVSFNEYTGPQRSAYEDHTLVSSEELFSGFISKKSLHSAFSVIFGVCLAIAIMSFLIIKSRENSKFVAVIVVFVVYIIIAAFILKKYLSGTSELIAITGAMVPALVANHSNIRLKKEAPQMQSAPTLNRES